MDHDEGFYTLKGYQTGAGDTLTPAMEDYLEMICRILKTADVVRISALASALHVKPSSASKMIRSLTELGYVNAPKYGFITLTERGSTEGAYLLYRHDLLARFLHIVNNGGGQLEGVEKLEHFFDRETIKNLDTLVCALEKSGATAE